MQTKVREIGHATMLVEYVDENGAPQRVYLPRKKNAVAGRNIEIEDPAQGVPYGDLTFTDIVIQAQDLSRALHEAGLWTREDIARRPNHYVQTVVGLAGLSLTSILQRKE